MFTGISSFPLLGMMGKKQIPAEEKDLIPEIITNWDGNKQTYHLKSPYIKEKPVFHTFDHDYFNQHLLPSGEIFHRDDPENSTRGSVLKELVENVVKEIQEGKTTYTDFIVLKDKDFNKKTKSGSIILKYKDEPFILKLFLETPETFTMPYSKGWQSAIFFVMGGGINRFLLGFDRLKNLAVIKKEINASAQWKYRVELPRKWFVLPSKTRWFQVRSKNLAHENSISLPSAYGIIADAISPDKKFTLLNKSNRSFAMELYHFLNGRIDPNIDNFLQEKETGKIILIDTEPFFNLVGVRESEFFGNDYMTWYKNLSLKFLDDLLDGAFKEQ